MKYKKLLIGLGIVVAIVLVLFFGLSAKVYPVATVNGEMISAKTLEESYTTSYNYFAKVIPPSAIAEKGEEYFQKEVRRATLDTLIELTLVKQELATLFEPLAVEQEALRRVENTTTTEKTAEATRKILDLSLEDFKRIVLIPEARKQILIEELEKSKKKYEDWVNEARVSADVAIFLQELAWESGGELCPSICVEINEQPGVLDTFKEILPSSSTLQQLTPTTTTPQNEEARD